MKTPNKFYRLVSREAFLVSKIYSWTSINYQPVIAKVPKSQWVFQLEKNRIEVSGTRNRKQFSVCIRHEERVENEYIFLVRRKFNYIGSSKRFLVLPVWDMRETWLPFLSFRIKDKLSSCEFSVFLRQRKINFLLLPHPALLRKPVSVVSKGYAESRVFLSI